MLINKKLITKKSQMTFELFVGIGTLSLFFLLLSSFIISQRNDAISFDKTSGLESFGRDIQQKFFLTDNMRDGFYIKVSLPENIFGINYDLEIINNNLYLYYEDIDLIFALPEVSGEINSKNFILRKTEHGIVIQ